MVTGKNKKSYEHKVTNNLNQTSGNKGTYKMKCDNERNPTKPISRNASLTKLQ